MSSDTSRRLSTSPSLSASRPYPIMAPAASPHQSQQPWVESLLSGLDGASSASSLDSLGPLSSPGANPTSPLTNYSCKVPLSQECAAFRQRGWGIREQAPEGREQVTHFPSPLLALCWLSTQPSLCGRFFRQGAALTAVAFPVFWWTTFCLVSAGLERQLGSTFSANSNGDIGAGL